MKPPFNEPPSYWWDFSHCTNAIIVESNDDRFPIVGRFELKNDGSDEESVIKQADDLIADLKAGRKDPRKCAKEVESQSVK